MIRRRWAENNKHIFNTFQSPQSNVETVELAYKLRSCGFSFIWSDSLGAKTMCTVVRTSSGTLVIDPGVAEMQPSYPLSHDRKIAIRNFVLDIILDILSIARYVVVTHYHYDHHITGKSHGINIERAYRNKLLIIKDPNKYINESQWKRARTLIEEILSIHNAKLREFTIEPPNIDIPDPVENLREALNRKFGNYNSRRQELLNRGRIWFEKLKSKWLKEPWIKDNIEIANTKIMFGDGKTFELGDTILKILEPHFHGVEYDRTGWVTPLVVEKNNIRLFYSSDLMGPIIEDYAYEIINLKPNIIFLDGPPTYLYPYMFNRINLERAIENMIRIIRELSPELIIYDHHLLREPKWREKVSRIFHEAKKAGVKITTLAELKGTKPLIDKIVMKD